MAFPFSIVGSFRIPRDGFDRTTPEQIGFRVVHLLQRASATAISQDGGTVVFSVAMVRFVSKWNILLGIDSGRVHISDTGDALLVEFRFSMLRNHLVAAGLALAAGYYVHDRVPVSVLLDAMRAHWPVLLVVPAILCVGYIIKAVRLVVWLKRGCQDGWGSWL